MEDAGPPGASSKRTAVSGHEYLVVPFLRVTGVPAQSPVLKEKQEKRCHRSGCLSAPPAPPGAQPVSPVPCVSGGQPPGPGSPLCSPHSGKQLVIPRGLPHRKALVLLFCKESLSQQPPPRPSLPGRSSRPRQAPRVPQADPEVKGFSRAPPQEPTWLCRRPSPIPHVAGTRGAPCCTRGMWGGHAAPVAVSHQSLPSLGAQLPCCAGLDRRGYYVSGGQLGMAIRPV